jgi:hypothetical protein
VEVSATLARLSENVTYHVRIVATNPGGASVGTDQTFTTASEELPEAGRCLAAPEEGAGGTRHGRYTTSTCTTKSEADSGGYEWTPGLPGEAFSSSGGPSTLETVGGIKLTCEAEAGTGEYTEARTEIVNITFTGCTSAPTVSCQSEGAVAGEITLHALEGGLGFIRDQIKEGRLFLSVGLDLEPSGSEPYVATFACGGVLEGSDAQVLVRGSVIAPITPIDRMSPTASLRYTAARGQQRPEALEGAQADVLLTSLAGGAFEQSGLTATSTITDEEPVEIKATR